MIHSQFMSWFWFKALFWLCSIAHVGFGQHSVQAQEVTSTLLGRGTHWQTPIYIQDSGVDGPTVIVTGGIHGNEPAGSRAAQQIKHWPIRKGKLIVIPKVNVAALAADKRYTPGAEDSLRDLNRNFPFPDIHDSPRGEIATDLWNFLLDQDPDWLFDLHEGYHFNISHQPPPGKDKSVGSTIICDRQKQSGVMTERMLASANDLVTRPDRKFLLKERGPKRTTLASAVIHVLGKPAMILETTHQFQRMPVRTAQHRAMMSTALMQIGMLEKDCANVFAPPKSSSRDIVHIALYDDTGASENGVVNLTKAFDADAKLEVSHLSSDQIRAEVLEQFDVVVFGGGSGSKEAESIGVQGAEVVRSFVKSGGGYIGVCAGAYLCSSHYTWSLNLVDTHVLTGKRLVEGQGEKSMWYRGKVTKQKIQLTEEGQQIFAGDAAIFDVKYQNGPIVSPRNFPGLKPYTVLSWFRSEKVLYPPQEGTMINTPAIVMGDYGKGKVISISPHPEATDNYEAMLPAAVKAVSRNHKF